MQFPGPIKAASGVVVAVSALKSRDSLGVGEFTDLSVLGRWAVGAGLSIIQILPVNDTGFEASPYSALSAFALHPLYGRLKDFPEAEDSTLQRKLSEMEVKLDASERLDFSGVLSAKIEILKAMWPRVSSETLKSVANWEKENSWVRNYALFSFFKERNGLKAWSEWAEHRNPKPRDLKRLWKNHKEAALFYVWVQFRLEQQFKQTVEELQAMGIALKGDIPILINDDSADIWADRDNFHLHLRAGSPPDAGSPDGQNWGFPTYNWNHLEKEEYKWWRERLTQASKFYHAYRIDHVLGFFRIWAVPESISSARCGHFEPAAKITRRDFEALGWDDGRITWMTEAHIPGEKLRDDFGPESSAVEAILDRVGSEDLWKAKTPDFTERDVYRSNLSNKAKDQLAALLRDRCFVPVQKDSWAPNWSYSETRAWRSLSDDERSQVHRLIEGFNSTSEVLWEERGKELLTMMKGDGSMLVCAEDLGAVPACVPRVLESLEILGLKVLRWARNWSEDGQPYIPPAEYPRLSVATGSVHDSSTLRAWLADEASNDHELRIGLGLSDEDSLTGTAGLRRVISALNESGALWVIHPLQDLLALVPSLVSDNPDEERFNVPGTVQPRNWTWRMKPYLEDLLENKDLQNELSIMIRDNNGGDS